MVTTIPVCLAVDIKHTADECITLAPKHIVTIDGILLNKSSTNKSLQLRKLQNTLRDCSLVTRGTKYESLFYDASGKALQMSVIVNDTHNSSMMNTLEDMHIEITHLLNNIAR